MKKLILVVLATLGFVFANAQNSITYLVDKTTGEVSKVKKTEQDSVKLTYGKGVSELTPKQVATLLETGECELSHKKIKGYYKSVLYYIPQYKVEMAILSAKNVSVHTLTLAGDRQFAFWLVFGILGIACAIFVFFSKENISAIAIAIAFAFAFAFAFAIAIASAFAIASAIAFAFAIAFAISGKEKYIKIFFLVYIILMALAILFIYI